MEIKIVDENEKRFERSPETEALLKFFETMTPGTPYPLEAVSAVVGFDVSLKLGRLRSAREIFLRWEKGKIDLKRGCINRCTDREVIEEKQHYFRRKASNAAGRGGKSLKSVEYDQLSPEHKLQHNVGLSVLGAIRMAAGESAQKRLAAVAQEAWLPSEDTLRILGEAEFPVTVTAVPEDPEINLNPACNRRCSRPTGSRSWSVCSCGGACFACHPASARR